MSIIDYLPTVILNLVPNSNEDKYVLLW